MTPFLPDLALRLPIPCSILSGNVLQSLGEHIATLNVDGRIVFQLGFANAPASAGTQADAWPSPDETDIPRSRSANQGS
jgi:hypothetical protein